MNKFIEVDIANTDSKTLVRSERFMSNKTEILSFDDWINVNGFNFRPEQYDLYKSLYEEGQQSKQVEIDHLQKRIDEISNHLEINYDENRDDYSHIYWSGYNQALRELSEILKGEQTK